MYRQKRWLQLKKIGGDVDKYAPGTGVEVTIGLRPGESVQLGGASRETTTDDGSVTFSSVKFFAELINEDDDNPAPQLRKVR